MTTTAPAVISKPMLFSGPMVLTILSGAKSQTRRVILKNPEHNERYEFRGWRHDPDRAAFGLVKPRKGLPLLMPSFGVKCPHPVGSIAWVKENCWIAKKRFGDADLNNCEDYDGDGRCVGYSASMCGDSVRCARDYGVKQSPSIFMPKWASRIDLKITGVRVERLQEISFEDCRAEGASPDWKCSAPECREPDCHGTHYGEKWHCQHIWDSLNGKTFPWVSNPWVWVYQFHRIKP